MTETMSEEVNQLGQAGVFWASSSFLYHYDETKTLPTSQHQICAICTEVERIAEWQLLQKRYLAVNKPNVRQRPKMPC